METLSQDRLLKFKLAQIENLGAATFKQIIDKYEKISDFLDGLGIERIEHLNKGIISGIKNKCNEIDTDLLLGKLEKNDIGFVIYGEKDYPMSLAKINDPPKVLYYKGAITDIDWGLCFSVVGTRSSTRYGQIMINKIVPELVHKGFCIVSGMAYGIDSLAHLAAISSCGKTIAVLGTPLDNPGPKGNLKIFDKVLDSGGIVLSELAPGKEIATYCFPARNRIIAGLSVGTLIVEAPKKSGALITADKAFGYGRQVFGVPADVGKYSSEGVNNLIRDTKAKLVTCADDIIGEFGFLAYQKKLVSDTNAVLVNRQIALSDNEKQILSIVKQAPLTEEDLMEKFDIEPDLLLASLTKLEIAGILDKGEDGRLRIK